MAPRRDALTLAVAVILTAAAAAAGPPTAAALDDRQRFAAATARLADGDLAGAADDLIAVADTSSDGELAADALFTAAGILDQRLADPARALALYRRIVRDHPGSRAAAAATRLAERLGTDAGPGGHDAAPAAAFARILAAVGSQPEARSLADAQPLADADWPGAPRVALWIADVHRRAGRGDQAIRRYRAVAARWPATDHEVEAWSRAADTALAGRDGRAAADFARRLPATTEVERATRDGLLAAAGAARRRTIAQVAAWIALLAAVGGLLASLLLAMRARHPHWRWALPPLEVWYMAPVAGLLAAASLTANLTIAPAVIAMCGGGVAVTWLSGAGLAAAGPRPGRRIAVHVVLSAVAAVALAAIALLRGGLVETLVETVRFGPNL